MTSPPLACAVRGCGLPLTRQPRAFGCPRGHTFDIARSGYLNLLQPQDRRAPEPGDARSAVAARRRLLDAGIGRAILDEVVREAAALLPADDAAVLDLGSGTGDALAALARARPMTGIGLDLSTAAADHAARRHPALAWVVANADRRVPLLDGCTALILSLHARRNPAECARVLAPGGHLLIAVPAPDDLIELREAVMGSRVERAREDGVRAEHEPLFTLERRRVVRERHRLERDALLDLLRATYRGGRASEAARVEGLGALDVTLASEFFLFRRPRH